MKLQFFEGFFKKCVNVCRDKIQQNNTFINLWENVKFTLKLDSFTLNNFYL